MNQQLVESVVDSLRPSFIEQLEDYGDGNYWERYEDELGCIKRTQRLLDYLNHFMWLYYSSTPEHHACTDVASTLAELDSHFGSLLKFK